MDVDNEHENLYQFIWIFYSSYKTMSNHNFVINILTLRIIFVPLDTHDSCVTTRRVQKDKKNINQTIEVIQNGKTQPV